MFYHGIFPVIGPKLNICPQPIGHFILSGSKSSHRVYVNVCLRDGSKFIEFLGRNHRQGAKTFFEKIGGPDFFFEKN